MSGKIICPMTMTDVTTPLHECVPECAWRMEMTHSTDSFSMCAIALLAMGVRNDMHDNYIFPFNYDKEEE